VTKLSRTARIAFDRLGVLSVPAGPVTPALVSALLAELAHVGVRVTDPRLLTDGAARQWPALAQHIRHRRGQRGTYSPLFAGFPNKLPSWDDGYYRMFLGAVRLAGGANVQEAMSFEEFGWWPASSVPQDVDRAALARVAQRVLPGDTRIEWITVRAVAEDQVEGLLRQFMRDCFGSASSLRDDVKADLRTLVQELGIDGIALADVRFRENRALLLQLAWETEPERIVSSGATPDDLLRLFAALTGGDVSLAGPVTFPRLSRVRRRVVVACLENSERLGDIFRRRGLWLAIDRGLHLGEFTAPRTREAFARLRETRHDRTSLGSRFEVALAADVKAAVRIAADEAPGLLGRQLRRVASLAGDDLGNWLALTEAIRTSGRVPLRILYAARTQLADNGATYPRVAFTKTGVPLPIRRAPGHLAVGDDLRWELLRALDDAIAGQLAAKGSWAGERVFVDHRLNGVLLPDQLRSTAPGLVQAERGSRLPLGDARVLRLFVHWREDGARSDLDLSCIAMDERFRPVEQVSWTNLANDVMTHSGDLVSAPDGAEEFIDINLRAAKRKGRRYLVPAIFRYAGPGFAALAEADVGWMLRHDCSTDVATFDPATVVNAFALTGRRRTAAPILVDLHTDEVLYVDVYLKGDPHAMVERDADEISAIVSAVAARARTKMSVADLALSHATARGAELVGSAAGATLTFGLDDGCTYNALRPEKLLADLL
jgi:hypothetical protein